LASPVRLSLLCDADDPFLTEAKQALAALKMLGIAAEWTETTGGHDWSTWRNHLVRVLPWVFR
jgi:enterochelin esterase-like enzyme